MDFQFLLLSFFWRSTLYSSILVGLILLSKRIFKDKISIKHHYYIWFILVVYLFIPLVPLRVSPLVKQLKPLNPISQQFNIFDSFSGIAAVAEDLVSSIDVKNNWNIIPKQLFFLIWIVVFLGLLIFYSTGYIRMKREIGRSEKIKDPQILKIFEQCRNELSISSEIDLYYIKKGIPSVFGIVSPKILIPFNMLGKISKREVYYIFLHELIHIKRKDSLVNGLLLILHIVHWFNPILWFVFNQIKSDQEISCDHYLLKNIQSSEKYEYGSTLINVSNLFSGLGASFGYSGFTDKKNNTKRRIIMISNFKEKGIVRSSILKKVLFCFICILFFSTKLIGGGVQEQLVSEDSQTGKITLFNSDFIINSGFRERIFDSDTTFSIAFWIHSEIGNWENISSISFISDENILYEVNDILEDEGYYNDDSFFFQVFLKDKNVLQEQYRLEFKNTKGEIYVVNEFPLDNVSGELSITELADNSNSLNKTIKQLHFTGIDSPDYNYYLEVYGEEGLRVFSKKIDINKNILNVDFSHFPEGFFNIAISKHDSGNYFNFVSREYYRIIN